MPAEMLKTVFGDVQGEYAADDGKGHIHQYQRCVEAISKTDE